MQTVGGELLDECVTKGLSLFWEHIKHTFVKKCMLVQEDASFTRWKQA